MKTHEPVYDSGHIQPKLAALPGWNFRDGWLQRQFKTDGWRSTMLLVNAVAFVAEAANHHPDMEVSWGSVSIRLQTHSAGGVTDKDLQLAARIEETVTWRPTGGFPGLEGQSSGWISR